MTTDDHVLLGDGPVAAVFACVDTTGTAYALKVFPGPIDRRARAALDAELARLAALRQSAAILVADSVETRPDGRCALRMELCAQSLPDLIDSFGPLSVPDAVVLGTVLAAALAAAHRAGLVHGGVTPGNVLFRPSGEPVLSDFGPTLRDAFPRDPQLSGQPTAPETIREGVVDERSDLYGLGVILYLALTGEVPHRGRPGEPQDARLLRVLGTPVPPVRRADTPPELVTLVGELLADPPSARPAGAAVVAERMDALRRRLAAAPDEPSAPEEAATSDEPAAFDDFAEVAPERVASGGWRAAAAGPGIVMPAPPDTPAPIPRGKPILVFGPGRPGRRPGRSALIAGAVVAVLAASTVLLTVTNRPDERAVAIVPAPTGSAGPSSDPAGAKWVELADPAVVGDVVELSWTSSGPMDFVVIVAEEGEQNRPVLVQRNTSHRVTVDPGRKYCFQVQGTDGVDVLESEAKPIHGAICNR